MAKVTSIHKARRTKAVKDSRPIEVEGFTPCSQDMTICGDCEGNRNAMKCPRLREWLAKRRS